jgi:hypothetical protein
VLQLGIHVGVDVNVVHWHSGRADP